MKISIYKIEQEYIQLTELLLENGGELTDEIAEQLAINETNLQTKATNYGFVVKQLDAESEIIDSEIKRLSALKKSREKAIDRLKETLKKAMELYQVESIDSPVMKINFRKSESVEIENDAVLDREYMVEKTTFTPDKTKIKEAIKAGRTIQGAVLKINKNIQIK